jgi:hypothetical protein
MLEQGRTASFDQVKTYELELRDLADPLANQEPIARLLCPNPEHDGPCEIPWGFSIGANHALILGIHTSPEKAVEVADAVRRLTDREVSLTEARPGHFDELAEQYAIEHPAP